MPSLLDLLLVLLITAGAFLICLMVALIVLVIVFGPDHLDFLKDPAKDPRAVLFGLLLQLGAYILAVGFIALYFWGRYRTSLLKAIQWNMPSAKLAWMAVAGGVGVGLISELASGVLHRWIPKSLPVEEYFRTTSSAYALAAFGILVAPVVEEIFFRGLIYTALARPVGVAPATLITSILFAFLHAGQLALAWAPLLIVFAVGTVLTIVRAKTKSVATGVLVHMAYNTTLFTLLFIVTSGFRHMERAS